MIFNITGGGGGTGCTLTITAPVGATVTVSKDGKAKPPKIATTGTVIFRGLETGVWTIAITNGTATATKEVEIKADYQAEIAFVKIYGISRDITAASPSWARTDDAVGNGLYLCRGLQNRERQQIRFRCNAAGKQDKTKHAFRSKSKGHWLGHYRYCRTLRYPDAVPCGICQ